MSGHSKWASIKHKKGAADAKRGVIFTKHAKLITLAAKNGGDPDMNPALRTAIDNAKAENMPNNNIERAIKKGTGEDKDSAELIELIYEGYGPGGTAVYVKCVTDNKNRTVANVKHLFSKHGGSLGTNGCVAWMFENKGIITIDLTGQDPEEVELAAIEAGASDTQLDGTSLEVHTEPADINKAKEALEAAGIKLESAKTDFVPKESVKIEEEEIAKKIMRLIDALEDDEDITNVASNFDIAEDILENIA